MGNNPSIGEIVRKKSKERGLSLAKLAFELGVNQIYLLNVLHGRKVSRPLIRKIAEVLHIPDLPSQYETYLASSTQKRGKKSKSKKSNKGGDEK